MKKALAIATLLVYFTVSTGFVVSMHYCMDRFDSAQLGSSGDDKCHKCGMHKDGGCCRDEVTVVKLQTNHMAASALQPDFALSPLALTPAAFLAAPFKNYDRSEIYPPFSPPPDGEQDTYLKNCVFRI